MMYGLYFSHIDINMRCDEVLLIVLVQCIFNVFLCMKFYVYVCICIWSSIMFSLYITVHHLRECVVNWCKWRTVYNVECFKFRQGLNLQVS
jgi:hypothetical protein